MRDLLTETLGRLVYVTAPIWWIAYLAWRREWQGALAAVVWMVPLFVLGAVVHTTWIIWKTCEWLAPPKPA